jgi:hypothetical protein
MRMNADLRGWAQMAGEWGARSALLQDGRPPAVDPQGSALIRVHRLSAMLRLDDDFHRLPRFDHLDGRGEIGEGDAVADELLHLHAA